MYLAVAVGLFLAIVRQLQPGPLLTKGERNTMPRKKTTLHVKIDIDVIRRVNKLTGSPKSLYLALVTYADFKTGICWPSYKTLSRDTGITSTQRLKEVIFILVDENLITTWRKGKRRYYKVRTSSQFN